MRGTRHFYAVLWLIGLGIACSGKGSKSNDTATSTADSPTAQSSTTTASGAATASNGAPASSSGGAAGATTSTATTSSTSSANTSGGGTSGSSGGVGGSAGASTTDGTTGAGGEPERPASDLSQTAYLKSPLLPDSNRFGAILDADGDTLVVGTVPSVQVFVDDGQGWVHHAELFGQAENNLTFGNAVAVSGDTIVVGAFGEADDGGNIQGAAYVFVRNGDSWEQQAHLVASNPGYDYFGVYVAIDGDVIALTAPYESSSPGGDPLLEDLPNSGAAYVFERANGNWTETAILKADNADESDQFGSAVDVSGDSIIVGAAIEASAATGVDGDASDNSAQTRGAAYIFARNGQDWTQQAYLKPSRSDYVNAFGGAVAISGDTAVVATTEESSSSTGVNGDDADATAASAGAAWVFVRSGEQWQQQAYIKASNTDAGDYFGARVALDGDLLVVGAPRESSSARGINGPQDNNDADESGAVYSFVRANGLWSQQDYITASNADAGDGFGNRLAFSGGTLAVSAEHEASGNPQDPADNSLQDAGAIYVYR